MLQKLWLGLFVRPLTSLSSKSLRHLMFATSSRQETRRIRMNTHATCKHQPLARARVTHARSVAATKQPWNLGALHSVCDRMWKTCASDFSASCTSRLSICGLFGLRHFEIHRAVLGKPKYFCNAPRSLLEAAGL